MSSVTRPLLALLALLTLAGCAALPRPDPARAGPFHTPANIRGVGQLPAHIRRIALLPCAPAGPRLTGDTLAALDRILAANLTAAARAEVTPVTRERLHALAGRADLLSTAPLPPDLYVRISEETGADAILLVDITAHSPYPPLILGLRARLVDISDNAVLWNFDNIFSAADPAVANSARAHHLGRTFATGTPADVSHTVLQNPSAYAGYVATATWQTLPPR